MPDEPDRNSMNFTKIFWILIGIPGKPFKVLQNSGFRRDFESAGFGILHKLLLPFLEILKFLGTQFNVVHTGRGVDIFWNSPMFYETFICLYCSEAKSFLFCSLFVLAGHVMCKFQCFMTQNEEKSRFCIKLSTAALLIDVCVNVCQWMCVTQCFIL